VENGEFTRDGRPHQVISGAIHYFRVHPDLWEDRLRRLRAMGLNAIETYIPWNFHERHRGAVDFTGPRDVRRFARIAGELGLDVILRPGPYVCAEWDFGGLPAWIMGVAPLGLRTSDPSYLAALDTWFDAVCAEIRPLLATNGGPVLAVQVENEYGSYGDDAAYLEHCRSALADRGIDVLLFTSDGPGPDWLASGTIPGVLATANFGSRVEESFAELRKFQPSGPDMCMEFWQGWFDHWGEAHHVRDPQEVAGTLEEILRRGSSVNIYMAHGGTNSGLWAGANTSDGMLQPTVTSYDYDAPISESGELTAKFHAYREVIGRYVPVPGGPLPETAPRLAPQRLEVLPWGALLDAVGSLDAPRSAPNPLSMEDLEQDHGLVVYRADALIPPDGRALVLAGLADRATVLVDGVVLGTVDRNDPQPLPLTARADGRESRLELVVENQGRINYGPLLGERKGVSGVRIAQRWVHGWDSVGVRLDQENFIDDLCFDVTAQRSPSAGPAFWRSRVEVDAAADGYISLPGWSKGFVWLNGTLLGRYWDIGPQATLYAASPLWRDGINDIVVLEMLTPGQHLEIVGAPELGAPIAVTAEDQA
jgi:beta-galactosidase